MRSCKECKHCEPADGILRFGKSRWEYAKCLHPSSKKVDREYDVVTGHVREEAGQYFCKTIRQSLVSGNCGELGIHFERKEAPPKRRWRLWPWSGATWRTAMTTVWIAVLAINTVRFLLFPGDHVGALMVISLAGTFGTLDRGNEFTKFDAVMIIAYCLTFLIVGA